VRGVDRERRLADPGHPVDRRDHHRPAGQGRLRRPVHEGGERVEFGASSDEVADRRRQLAGYLGRRAYGDGPRFGVAVRRRRGQRGIAGQHAVVQALELRARFDPELLDQHVARLPVAVQSLGGPSAAVQGEHQLGMEALAQRVPLRQIAQLRHDVLMPAEIQVGLDADLERLQPQLLEPGSVFAAEPLGTDVGQRASAPQVQGLVEGGAHIEPPVVVPGDIGLPDQAFEAGDVQLLLAQADEVARSRGHEAVGAQGVAQVLDVVAQRRVDRGGRGRVPDDIGQLLRRDRLVGAQGQSREHRALDSGGHLELPVALANRQRAQHAYPHRRPPLRRLAIRGARRRSAARFLRLSGCRGVRPGPSRSSAECCRPVLPAGL
jgi:hypothetical protein